jgi:hypothetical protein
MTERDRPASKISWNWDRVLLALALVVAIGFGLDQHWADEKIVAALTQQLQSSQKDLKASQEDLKASQAENAALSSVSLDTFLRQYNAHVAALKTAAEAYEAAKAAKGSDRVYALMAVVTAARDKLYTATDDFTDYVDRWRLAAELLNKMLDGNVTQLENSRREDNADGVHDAVRRIVRSAPDLATPLRVALDKLRPPAAR